jgi:hypothetical protein
MKRWLLAIIMLLLWATGTSAQTTTVSATVVDPTGNPYVNGSFTAQFYDPGTSGKIPLINGSTFQTVLSGQLDSFGFFSTVVTDNVAIASSSGATNTTWVFSICSQTYSTLNNQKFCFSWTAPLPGITGPAMNISAQLKAVAATLPTNIGGGSLSVNTISVPNANLQNNASCTWTVVGSNVTSTCTAVFTGGTVPNPTTFSSLLTLPAGFISSGPNTLNGVNTLSVLGNAALKNGTGDGVCYATTTGVDTNDGLSWGTSKLTIRGCLIALPNGATSPDTAGYGTVYYTDGVAANTTGTGCGIWLMGSADPNYASPPSCWMRYPGGNQALAIIGVPKTAHGPNPPMGKALLGAGNSADRNHPALYLSNIAGGLSFANMAFQFPGRGIVIGECSNQTRTNTCNSSSITFDNVTANVNDVLGNGPTWDITGQSFWIYINNSGGGGTDDTNSPGSDNAATMLIDGRTNSGVGLIFLDKFQTDNGGVVLYAGTNFGQVVVNHLTTEGQKGEAAIHIKATGGSGDNNISVTANDIQIADATGSTPAIQNDTGNSEGILATNLEGQTVNAVGPMVVLSQFPQTLTASTSSPLSQGQLGFFGKTVVGQNGNTDRLLSPVPVRYANLAATASGSWTTSFASSVSSVAACADPAGGTLAGCITYVSGGTAETAMYYAANTPITVGDWYAVTAMVKSTTSNGYSGNTPIEFVLNAQGYGAGDVCNTQSAIVGANSYFKGDGQWERVWALCKVTANPANAGIAMVGLTDSTHNLAVYGPTLIHISTGTVSVNEAWAIASGLQPYSNTCSVGQLCTVSGAFSTFAFNTPYVQGGIGYSTVQAAINALGTSPGTVIVPPGTWSSTSTITMTNSGQHLQCAGIKSTTIAYTGGATTAILDIGTSLTGSPILENVSVNGCTFSGNANVNYGIRIRSVQRSDFSDNAMLNIVTAGIQTNFGILNRIDNLHVSTNEQAMTTTPVSCFELTGTSSAYVSVGTTMVNPVCEGTTGNAGLFTNAQSTNLIGGTFEANGGWAIILPTFSAGLGAIGNTFTGTFFQSNTSGDISVSGQNNKFDTLQAASAGAVNIHFFSGGGENTVLNGYINKITIDSGALRNGLHDVTMGTGGANPGLVNNEASTDLYNVYEGTAGTLYAETLPGSIVTPNITITSLTPGNCMQAGTGGKATTVSGPCSTGGTVNNPNGSFTQGGNLVAANSGVGAASSQAYLDCSVFSGADWTLKVQACLSALNTLNSTAGIADARGIAAGGTTGSVNPEGGTMPNSGVLLMGPGTYTINVPFVDHPDWSVIGTSIRGNDGQVGTTIKAGASFPAAYTTGTIIVGTVGANDVITGSGTSWTSSNVVDGMILNTGGGTNSTWGVVSAFTSGTSITLNYGVNNGTGAASGSGYTLVAPVHIHGNGGGTGNQAGMSSQMINYDCNNVAGCIPDADYFGQQGTFDQDVGLHNFNNIGLDLEGLIQNSTGWKRIIASAGTSCTANTLPIVFRTNGQQIVVDTVSAGQGLCATIPNLGIDVEGNYSTWRNLDLESDVVGIALSSNPTCPYGCAMPPRLANGTVIDGDWNLSATGTTIVHISNSQGSLSDVSLKNIQNGRTNALIDDQHSCTSTDSRLMEYTIDHAGNINHSTSAISGCDVLSTPGSYTSANITVNANGQVTAAANGSGGGGTPGSPTLSFQYNNGGVFGGITPATTNGLFYPVENVTANVATAPQLFQVGMGGRAITGASTSDTIGSADVGSVVGQDVAASGTVTETVPTATTLLNPAFAWVESNHSAQTLSIQPSTWTIQSGTFAAAATLSLPPGAFARIKVDPNSSTNWLADVTYQLPISASLVGSNSSAQPIAAAGTDVNTLIKTLTGCNTATFVYTPQAADCVAPGGGTPCTSIALSLQYNNAGAFGCVPNSAIDTATSLVSSGHNALVLNDAITTGGAGFGAHGIDNSITYTGSTSTGTLSASYNWLINQGTGGTNAHNVDVVSRINDTSTGMTNSITDNFYADWAPSAQTGTSTFTNINGYAFAGGIFQGTTGFSVGEFDAFHFDVPTVSSPAVITKMYGFNVNNFPSSNNAQLTTFHAINTGNCTKASVYAAIVACGGTSYFQAPIIMSFNPTTLDTAPLTANSPTMITLTGFPSTLALTYTALKTQLETNHSSGTVTALLGEDMQAQNGNNGTITTLAAFKADAWGNQASGVITNAYGMWIGAPGNSGTYTNISGLRIDAQTAATNTNAARAIDQQGASDVNNLAGITWMPANRCTPTSALTLSASYQAICSWNLPKGAHTYQFSCDGIYSLTAGTLPTLLLAMNASQTPGTETGTATIWSTSAGTLTSATVTATSSGDQALLTGVTNTTANMQFHVYGMVTSSATAGTFAIDAEFGGTGSPAGTVNIGTVCSLY